MTAKPAAALTAEHDNTITIRVSSAGECPRRLILAHKGIAGLPEWEGRKRAFEEGNLHEAGILAWAAENIPGGPWRLFDQQREVVVLQGVGVSIVGHPDALAEGAEIAVFEAKALSKWSFQEFREKGLRESHPGYYSQVQLYIDGQQRRRKWRPTVAYLTARNKDTHKDRYWDHHWERIEYDPAFCEREIKRLVELAGVMRSGGDIEPPYHPSTDFRCKPKWCPYALECHPTYQPPIATAERNEDLLPTITRYMELGEEIKALESERDFLKAHLQTAAAGGEVLAGDWRVRMAVTRRESFDTKLARKELATDVLARFLKVSETHSLKIEEVL